MSIERKEWEGFEGRIWKEEVNVRDFIQNNYKPYDGDESFLAQTNYGANYRNYKKKNVPKVAFWIWKPRLFLL